MMQSGHSVVFYSVFFLIPSQATFRPGTSSEAQGMALPPAAAGLQVTGATNRPPGRAVALALRHTRRLGGGKRRACSPLLGNAIVAGEEDRRIPSPKVEVGPHRLFSARTSHLGRGQLPLGG